MKNFKVLLLFPNEPLLGVTPSNLAILSAYLKADDFEVKLFDSTIYRPKQFQSEIETRVKLGHVKKTDIENYIHPLEVDVYDDFERVVNEYKPNLIGISLIDSTIGMALKFLDKIKNKIKERNITIIGGGVTCAFLYERILNTNVFDYLCIGEGEGALVELCNKLMNGEDCSSIKNLYYKKDGKIIKNPIRPLVNLNDMLVPDFSIYEDWRFYRPYLNDVFRMAQIDIVRGCPHSCTYCLAPDLRKKFKTEEAGHYYRVKSIDKMIGDIKEIVEKYNLNFLWISSETFLALSVNKLKELAKRYVEEINLPFWTSSRLDTFTEEKTKILAEMGCKGISVGFEHGDEKIRNELLKKNVSDEQTLEGFKMLAKYGIHATVNSMIGLPGETRENVFKTIKMNKAISEILQENHNINVFTFMPFSGTQLREICLEKGYIENSEDIPCSLFDESILNMPKPFLSQDDIRGLQKTMSLYIKLPESYYPSIKIAEKNDEEGNEMFEKLMKLIT